jgi:chromosome partitioning protein
MMFLTTSRKGGTGKTSLCVNLAACWAAQRVSTLLIDLDPQADASVWLGLSDTGEALADALLGKSSLTHAIRSTESGVDVAAGGEALDLVAERVRPTAVQRALGSLPPSRYARVMIDCPPALTPLVLAAYRAAPTIRALVPIDGPSGLRAVARLRHAWDDAGLQLGHIMTCLVRYDRRRVLDQSIRTEALAIGGAGHLASTIRETVIVAEAAAWRRPLELHAPKHAVAADFRALAREVIRG